MPINISSKDNERVKYTKSLLKSKNRQKETDGNDGRRSRNLFKNK